MRTSLIASLLTAMLATTPAFAQNSSPGVGGFHVEAVGGYDSTQIQEDGDGGLIYGAGAGYDFRVGRAILGVQAEATDSTNDGCTPGVLAPGDSFCSTAGRELFIGGRAGFMAGRKVLVYGTAGYANARFHTDYEDGTAAGTNDFSYSQNLDGVRIGAGGELGLGRNAFVRAEVRYTNYEQGGDRGQGVAGLGFRF